MNLVDIDQIRRSNILTLEAEAGGAPMLSKLVGMSYAQYVNLRDGAKDSVTGKPRGMRKETARKFEVAGKKPDGWMDIDHASVVAAPMTCDDLLKAFELLPPIEQAKFRGVLNYLELPPPTIKKRPLSA